jgi:hypothetical protein
MFLIIFVLGLPIIYFHELLGGKCGLAYLPASGCQKSIFIELKVSVQEWSWVTHKNQANSVCNDDMQLHHYAL